MRILYHKGYAESQSREAVTQLSLSLGYLGLGGDIAEQPGSPIHYWGKLQRMPSKGLFLFKDLFSLQGCRYCIPTSARARLELLWSKGLSSTTSFCPALQRIQH